MDNLSFSLRRFQFFCKPFSRPVSSIFLDRDGVLIEDKHHLSSPGQVVLLPGAQEVVNAANRLGWPVIIVTNQSGISRKLFSWRDYDLVTDRIIELLGPAAILSAVFANGEGPKNSLNANSWRKPSPLMLVEASKALNLDLKRSILFGDRLSDLQAGYAAGLAFVVHLLTGHGCDERESVRDWYAKNCSINSCASTKLLLLKNLNEFPIELLSSDFTANND